MAELLFLPLWDDDGPALLLFGVDADEYGATADLACALRELSENEVLYDDDDTPYLVQAPVTGSEVLGLLPGVEVIREP